MSINIPNNHLVWQVKSKIQEVTHGFMASFGFNYFQYLRCYADGSIGLLTNHTGLVEHFQHVDNQPVVFSSFDEANENDHAYWFLWDEVLPDQPVQFAREKFNIRNGLTYVRRNKHYYDMIAVAVPNELANPGSFYLNKLRAIEQFVMAFDHDNKDLIGLMDKNPMILPKPYRDENYDKICLHNGKVNVHGRTGLTYITAQELACLRLFVQGATYKQIARVLDISHRTVETYMLRARLRTGMVVRSDFEQMLSA